MTSPARGQSLVPVHRYAEFVAKNPKQHKDNNGSDPTRYPFSTSVIWGSEGGVVFGVIPPMHMKKIRAMGEECRREAEEALKTVKKDKDGATKFLIPAIVELLRGKGGSGDKSLADAAVTSYIEAASFMHEQLDPIVTRIYGRPISEAYSGPGISELIAAEKEERKELPISLAGPLAGLCQKNGKDELTSMEPTCLDASRLLLAGPAPYHLVTALRVSHPDLLFRCGIQRFRWQPLD